MSNIIKKYNIQDAAFISDISEILIKENPNELDFILLELEDEISNIESQLSSMQDDKNYYAAEIEKLEFELQNYKERLENEEIEIDELTDLKGKYDNIKDSIENHIDYVKSE